MCSPSLILDAEKALRMFYAEVSGAELATVADPDTSRCLDLSRGATDLCVLDYSKICGHTSSRGIFSIT
jgi:hypothetical protein